jgi:hypothetical protein
LKSGLKRETKLTRNRIKSKLTVTEPIKNNSKEEANFVKSNETKENLHLK